MALVNDSSSEVRLVTTPAAPISISCITMRRRTGWFTTDSDSFVVKPAPLNAERAWNRAMSRDSPVAVSITVATRVMPIEMVRIASNETMASMWRPHSPGSVHECSPVRGRPAPREGACRAAHLVEHSAGFDELSARPGAD